MGENREWFALSSSGKLWRLGECGSFNAAEETANDWELEVVWIANATTLKRWAEIVGIYDRR